MTINLGYDDYWKHEITPCITLDTSAYLKVLKKENKAHLILELFLKHKWAVFVPAPLMLEVGFGNRGQVAEEEQNGWRKLHRLNPEYKYSNEVSALSLYARQHGQSAFMGQITFVNPDVMNWFAAKHLLLKYVDANANQSPRVARSMFMDALIWAVARNLFSPVWTDNPKDFLNIPFYDAAEGGLEMKHAFVPVFTTKDLQPILHGGGVDFTTDDCLSSIKNMDVLNALKKLYRET